MGIFNPLNTVFNLQLQVGFCKFIKIPELRFTIDYQGMMEQQDTLKELANRFPEYTSQITNLLLNSIDFREIVEDYQYCRHKLNKLMAHPAENNPLIRHYERTMLELEEELLGYFAKE